MLEVELQTLVVNAVKKHGGYGWKLSNRFIVGVPDLLLQIPGQRTSIWEVKHKVYAVVRKVKVDVTPMQLNFLKKFHMAGGVCGMITFLSVGRRADERWFNATLYQDFDGYAHRFVPLIKGYREDIIAEELERIHAKEKSFTEVMGGVVRADFQGGEDPRPASNGS